MTNTVKKYPAPWNLNGSGYIILYKFSKEFVNKEANVPEFLKDKYSGGFGSVMLVNYKESNAGPYGELLFIPGKFKFNNQRLDTISKIYVSTMESVINGQKNWGIPKQKADFKFTDLGNNKENVVVSLDSDKIIDVTIKHGDFSFPVSTKLLPFPLVQEYENIYFYTNFYGNGKGTFGRIEKMEVNSSLFPDISKCTPIAIVRVDPFEITFPESKISKI